MACVSDFFDCQCVSDFNFWRLRLPLKDWAIAEVWICVFFSSYVMGNQ
jgi:hypothetical protein